MEGLEASEGREEKGEEERVAAVREPGRAGEG